MGRPGLSQNRKFRRLAMDLKSPANARGHLELMWDSAYEAGDEVLGDSLDVELAAGWTGDTGFLAQALVRTGFLDEQDGIFTIHDFWHHAPAYVRKRRSREDERRSKVDPCRTRNQSVTSQAEPHGNQPGDSDQSVTSQRLPNGPTPSPSPSPSPSPKDNDLPSADAPVTSPGKKPRGEPKPRVLGNYPEELNQAMEAWRDLSRELHSEEILQKFPDDPDGRYVAKVGTKGKAWEAWQKRVGCVTSGGVRVTHEHVLAGVKLWAEIKFRDASAGKRLSMPNLSSLINSADFEDALLRVTRQEMAHAI